MARPVDPTDQQILEQSRALGDPTRHAIFVAVRDAATPVTVSELTAEFGLNHNAIRQHVAKLRAAGLITEHHEPPTGPGRPPMRYRPVAGAAERWGGTNPHEALSMMLIELLGDRSDPRQVGDAAGRRLADEYPPDTPTLDLLDAIARRLGFEPRRVDGRTGPDLIFDRCPFVTPALVAPDVVCEIHRGIAEGIGECGTDGTVVTEFVVRTPRRGGCRIRTAPTV